MRFATRSLLAAFALVFAAGTASAQKNVTFQVDMTPYVTSCQFDDATEDVVVRGSFNDWSGDGTMLADDDGDNVFTGTFPFAEEDTLNYKFVSTGDLGFEDATGNRTYIVTADADQTIETVTFADGDPVDQCSATEQTYEVTFAVDMTQQIARGALDPATERVAVGGSFTGWDAGSAFELAPESDNPNIYSGTLTDEFSVPTNGSAQFKFVIVSPDGAGGFVIKDYEQPKAAVSPLQGGDGSNRLLMLTGDEPQDGTTGNRYLTYDNDDDENNFVLYSDADPNQFLNDAATVTFVVDLRPAYYALEDDGTLPNGITAVEDIYLDGPLIGESDQVDGPGGDMLDWASSEGGWTAENLADREVSDFGTFNAADSTLSFTLTYSQGATRVLKGKFSAGGPDNEAGSQDDKFITIAEGDQTVNLIFGAQVKTDGTISDNTALFDAYDPYILIDNTATPPTAVVVRSGGEADVSVANEAGPGREGDLALGAVYPNPAAGVARMSVSLARDAAVTIRVYDVTGRLVATVAQDAYLQSGQTVELDTRSLAAGLYVVRAEADGDVATRRLTVVR